MSRTVRHVTLVLAAVCALGVLMAGAAAAMAAPGELDSGFANGGVFTGSFETEPSGAPPRFQSAVVDSQRRTVIAVTRVDAQNRRHLDVMRLTAQGTLDTSFNPHGSPPGIVEVDLSAYVGTIDVYARGVAVVGGDGVVALGWVHDTNGNDFTALVRLGSDGSYDTTFGANHDGRTVDLRSPGYARSPDSLAIDRLGRILVGGSCGSSCGGFVARYTGTGAPDTGGFNPTDALHPGVVVIAQGSDVSSLVPATDGSDDILAADGSSSSGRAVVARIRPDGTLDPTFGSAGATPGVVESGMGCQACGSNGLAIAYGVSAGPGGTVYATGQVSDPGGAQSMRLLRLTQAGGPDPAFGSGIPAPGVVAAPSGIRGVSVAVDGSSCPVIVGYGLRSDQQVPNAQIVAARFTAAGAPDQAFNPAGANPGTATFPLGGRALGETVALQDDGKIVISGEVDQFGNATTRNAVVLRLQGGGCGTQQPPGPTVVTGQATNLSSNAATLNGTVNPNRGQVSDCHFDYGTSTDYTSSVPCSQSPGAGTSPVAVSAPISGIAPNTTYDYRLVATGPGGTSDGANQTFTTAPPGAPTTLSTVQVWGATRGASITVPGSASGEHDEAQLSGANAGSSSGSFTFSLYRRVTEGPQCTGTPVFTSTRAIFPVFAGGASSNPVPTQLAPGTYYWTVSYSGDADNQPTASACGSEVLTVQPPMPTTLSTVQVWSSTRGASITVPGSASGEHDEAQLSGANAGSSSGTFTFSLYRRAASGPQCTGTPVFTSTRAIFPVFAGGASSNPVPTQLAPGTYYWTVSYSGDADNQPTASACGSEVLTVQPPMPTTLSTVQVWGTTRGASITVPGSASGEHDEAQLSGANAGSSSGTFTFSLYRQGPSRLQCRGTPVFTSTRAIFPVFAGGTSSNPVPTQLAPGTYYWTVSYSGDSDNQPTASVCGSEVLTVQPARILSYGAFLSAQAITLNMSCIVPPCTAGVTITLPAGLRASGARQQGKSKPPVVTLARGRITIRKHGAQTVRLSLTAAGRRFVASHNGKVAVNAAVTITNGGHTTVATRRLEIKIKKPIKRQQR